MILHSWLTGNDNMLLTAGGDYWHSYMRMNVYHVSHPFWIQGSDAISSLGSYPQLHTGPKHNLKLYRDGVSLVEILQSINIKMSLAVDITFCRGNFLWNSGATGTTEASTRPADISRDRTSSKAYQIIYQSSHLKLCKQPHKSLPW